VCQVDSMDQLLNAMKDKGITQVKLFVVDIEGRPRFMTIPSHHLEEVVEGITIDGSSIPGFTTVDESDVIAKPDLESAVFSDNEVALFCHVEYENGQVFEGDPRNILKKVLQKGAEKGFFYAKPELEFYFLKGFNPVDSKGYMDYAEGLKIVEEVVSKSDVKVERIHHENGPAQYEIEPLMAPALKACDTIILLKEGLKQKAREEGITATFMPKPLLDEAGSGMHFHVLWEKNGKNLFEPFSETALYFVGGLLSHAKGITAVCNPTINSYKRLVPHFEAPVYISWGRGNRSALVRIPRGGKTRIEYRSPDPLCNPYLALALILGAGLHGVDERIEPPEEVVENIFDSEHDIETLPTTLEDALKELEKDDLIKEILGEHLIKQFINRKKAEIEDYRRFCTKISQWEYDHYLE